MARVKALAKLLALVVVLGHGVRRLSPERARHVPPGPRRLAASASLGLLLMSVPVWPRSLQIEIDQLDENGDGFVDKEEFMYAAKDSLDAGNEDDGAFRKAVYRYVEYLYEIVDVDGDGVLNPKELEFGEFLSAADAAKSRGGESSARTFDDIAREGFGLARAEQVMRNTDDNGDGVVDKFEYWKAAQNDLLNRGWHVASVNKPETQKVLHHIFGVADITMDGILGLRELQYASFLLYTYAAHELSSTILNELDHDGDGRISWEEAVATAEASPPPPSTPNGMRSIIDIIYEDFNVWDVDGNGFVDEQERHIMSARIIQGDPAMTM